ncbi:MAG TPA: hypothetical protein VFF07_14365 [Actinomycetota bacterium]|nr:hypothetical protein [Actinomycetota bacterium]
MKEAGLVTDRSEGTRRLYALHDEWIAAVRDYLERVWETPRHASRRSPPDSRPGKE